MGGRGDGAKRRVASRLRHQVLDRRTRKAAFVAILGSSLALLSVPGPTSQAQPLSVRYVPGSSQKVCQVTGESDTERQQPTLNRTASRFGVGGTDLGASFEHQGRMYFLFGDTIGRRPGGGADSVATSDDNDPEDCLALEFITERPGLYLPLRVPGVSLEDFEVPTGGFGAHGKIYVFFKTDYTDHSAPGRSVLASSSDGARSFTYLYDVSRDKFSSKIAPVAVNSADVAGLPEGEGEGVLMWGTGLYRQSDPYLSYVPLALVENRAAWRYFTGVDTSSGQPRWSADESDAAALFSQPCVGELSAAWNSFLSKWLMLYHCPAEPRGINFRVADAPWGPWSDAQVLFHPWDDEGYCHFIHVSSDFRNCDSVGGAGRERVWGGEYAPYLIPRFTTGDDSGTTIYYLMSTWNPYQVVLMRSRLEIERGGTEVEQRPAGAGAG